MPYVYVLRSETTGKTYVGQTVDLERRLAQHNKPNDQRSMYTKRNRDPWILIYKESLATQKETIVRERFLKSGKGREYLKKVINIPG